MTNQEEAFELYKQQQIRPTPEEIADVADRLWEHSEFGPIFRRTKLSGDLSEYEQAAIQRFIKEQQSGTLWDRRYADLWLATGLVRLRAAGRLNSFRSAKAREFIADRVLNAANGTYGHQGVDTTVHEILDLAQAMIDDSNIIALLRRRPVDDSTSREDAERSLNFALSISGNTA